MDITQFMTHRPPAGEDSMVADDATTESSTETDSSTASIQTVIHAEPAWSGYFAENLRIPSPSNPNQSFNVYYSPPLSPHGPVYVFHHGAGSSGLSFALTAEALTSSVSCGVISYDIRHHGLTTVSEADDWDLSLDTLAHDELHVIRGIAQHAGWPDGEWPDFILVGHSLGGAVSAHFTSSKLLRVLCLCVIDVVEGSAIDALRSMQTYLSTRPTSFPSLDQGISWHLKSRTIRNKSSATVSVPGLLVQMDHEWKWRTDLGKTTPFWTDWFTGLSNKFLTSPAGKLLLLAGTDRLDKPLMIGQMQGKYQLVIYPESGHFVHEDVPSKTAEALIELWRRNDREAIRRVALLNKQKYIPS